MTKAIRNPSWSVGLERGPPKACSPALCVYFPIAFPRGESSPTWPTDTQKSGTQSPVRPEMVRVRLQKRACHAATRQSCCGSSVGLVAVSVNHFPLLSSTAPGQHIVPHVVSSVQKPPATQPTLH